ncbi:MAG: DUF188 domain-containing protein [Sphaerochaetaceae bacterium]|nr:DUF188 domain-containing protein [Sphaerochaetaceae bacterium]
MLRDIWVDADSLPKDLRPVVIRLSQRLEVPLYFTADRSLPDVAGFICTDTDRIRKENNDSTLKSNVKMVVVKTGENSADNYIAEHAQEGSLCITHDIPLAARLLEKNCTVIDDRGGTYTSDNIKALLADRSVNAELRSWGVFSEQQSKHSKTSTKNFADNLDRTATKMKGM